MKETLERLAKEKDFTLLQQGLDSLYEENKGLLELIHQDATTLTLAIKNALKVLHQNGPEGADDARKFLKDAVKALQMAEKHAKSLEHWKKRGLKD